MSAQVAADLRAAADVLERDGWVQRVYTDRQTGRHCGIGAVATVRNDPFVDKGWQSVEDAWRALEDYLLSINVGYSFASWNDEPGRTADEVIAALRAAADRAEAEQ